MIRSLADLLLSRGFDQAAMTARHYRMPLTNALLEAWIHYEESGGDSFIEIGRTPRQLKPVVENSRPI